MPIQVVTFIATAAGMIFINAFYVAAEFASVASRSARLSALAEDGNALARRLLPIVQNRHRLDEFIAASQIGITASSLILGIASQRAAVTLLAPTLVTLGWLEETAAAAISATLLLITFTTLQVVFGELLPKSIALQFPERVAQWVIVPMEWSLILLKPFILILNGSGALLLRLLGRSTPAAKPHAHSPEEIELLVDESHEGGLLDDLERQMLRNALRLRDLTARQVMIPRPRLLTMPLTATVDDILAAAQQVGFSRIPLYDTTVDNITGFVHIKDLLRLKRAGQQDPRPTLRTLVYVPETLPIAQVWQQLSAQRKYLAVVFDEYGGTAGLLTVEDVVEEIFGELQDEFDREVALVSADRQGRYHLRGDLLVTDVNEYLDLKLPETDADTLGGLIFATLDRIPEPGDEISLTDLTIRVETMDGLRVTEVSLKLAEPDSLRDATEWHGPEFNFGGLSTPESGNA